VTSFAAVQLVLQHSSSTQSANLLANVVAEKSVSDASTSHHHHHHQQQQQQQHHDIKHQQDKENAAAAAQEVADRRARDARLRAAELHQLDNLLGATVASWTCGSLMQVGVRVLHMTHACVMSCSTCSMMQSHADVNFTVNPHSAHFVQEVRTSFYRNVQYGLCRVICPLIFFSSAAHHLVSIDISYNPLHQVHAITDLLSCFVLGFTRAYQRECNSVPISCLKMCTGYTCWSSL
jgi:hypothetical protein